MRNNYNNNFNRQNFAGNNNAYFTPNTQGPSRFGRAPYSPGYAAQQAPKKHSGCQYRENFISKTGKQKAAVMFGWNYSKQRGGIMKFVAVPANDTTVNNKSGKDLAKWVVTVTWANGQQATMSGFRNRATGKMTIPQLSMVASPSAPNGGYFGAAFRRK